MSSAAGGPAGAARALQEGEDRERRGAVLLHREPAAAPARPHPREGVAAAAVMADIEQYIFGEIYLYIHCNVLFIY